MGMWPTLAENSGQYQQGIWFMEGIKTDPEVAFFLLGRKANIIAIHVKYIVI